jgi:TGF-beta propeptide
LKKQVGRFAFLFVLMALVSSLIPTAVRAATQSPTTSAPSVDETIVGKSVYSTTYSEPDGDLRTEVSAAPVHYQDEDGRWSDIDNSLVRSGTGFANRSSAFKAAFADSGAAGQLVSVGYESKKISFGLEGATNASPQVDGSSITYPEILPGADLRFDVLGESVKESLVLKRVPRVPGKTFQLRFPLSKAGFSAEQVGEEILLKDSNGATVMSIGELFMFDSSGSAESAEPARSDAIDIGLSTSSSGNQSLIVQVDAAWLKDPRRVYPVTIDPSITGRNPSLDTFVQSNISSSQSLATQLSSGTFDSGTTKARTLVKFDLSDIPAGSTIESATLSMWENHSFSCTGSRVDVYRITDSWASGVTWTNKPAFTANPADSKTVAKGYSSSCASGWVDFNVTSPVDYWKNSSATNEGFGIRAFDEVANSGWKKFASAEAGNPPKLAVTYNTPPGIPTPVSPLDGATTSKTPILKATYNDQNPGDWGRVDFQIWNGNDCQNGTCSGSPVVVAEGSGGNPGTTSTLDVSSLANGNSLLSEGATYKWRGRGWDGKVYSGWSSNQSFTITDATGPAAPAVSSASHHLSGTWYANNDISLSWTAPNDPSGIAGYSFLMDQSDSTVPPTISAGPGTSTMFSDRTEGQSWFHVRAVDGAGNWGATTHFLVQVDASAPVPTEFESLSHPDPDVFFENSQANFSWSFEDSAGVDGYSLVFDADESTIPDEVVDQYGDSTVMNAPSNGVWFLHLRAKDVVGNWSETLTLPVSVGTVTSVDLAAGVTPEEAVGIADESGNATLEMSTNLSDAPADPLSIGWTVPENLDVVDANEAFVSFADQELQDIMGEIQAEQEAFLLNGGVSSDSDYLAMSDALGQLASERSRLSAQTPSIDSVTVLEKVSGGAEALSLAPEVTASTSVSDRSKVNDVTAMGARGDCGDFRPYTGSLTTSQLPDGNRRTYSSAIWRQGHLDNLRCTHENAGVEIQMSFKATDGWYFGNFSRGWASNLPQVYKNADGIWTPWHDDYRLFEVGTRDAGLLDAGKYYYGYLDRSRGNRNTDTGSLSVQAVYRYPSACRWDWCIANNKLAGTRFMIEKQQASVPGRMFYCPGCPAWEVW